MCKYIDADKLIAELRKHLIPTVLDREYDEWEMGKDAGLQQAIGVVESLQQEHPEVDLVEFVKAGYDLGLNVGLNARKDKKI